MTTPRYRFGPTIDGEHIGFRLYAPSSTHVEVIVEQECVAMNPVGQGWFEATIRGAAGVRYKFRVDGMDVSDPASRMQQGDVHGFSVVQDNRYVWRNTAWRGRPWAETIVYELHVGLLGGFAGVAQKLSSLAALGVSAIELMPIADFPGARNWGYDGVLPFAPDSSYGTPDALRELVDEAHGHGLMVFLDVVFNHFGPDGNYLPVYAKDFFCSDTQTPWGAAINFDNSEVERFYIENALYWFEEFQIDGLRLDAVHAINNDGFLRRLAHAVGDRVPRDRHVHLMVENENNDAALLASGFQAQWNDDVHHALHVLLTGEAQGYYADYAVRPIEGLARGLAEGFIYQGETGPHYAKPRGSPSAHLRPTSFIAFLQNHDHIGNRAFGERLLSLCEPKALRAAVALVMLSPQIPMVFMGEEVGATEPFLFFADYSDPKLAKAVREGRRAEFAHFDGFSDPNRRDSIPDPNDVETFERSRPELTPDAVWFQYYQSLIATRRRHIVPFLDGAQSGHATVLGEKALVVSWRLRGDTTLVLASDLGREPVALPTTDGTAIWGQPTPSHLLPLTTLCWIQTA